MIVVVGQLFYFSFGGKVVIVQQLDFQLPVTTKVGEVYSIQHYVKKFVSDLRQVVFFSTGTPASSTNKADRHDIIKMFSKVALNTITITRHINLANNHLSPRTTEYKERPRHMALEIKILYETMAQLPVNRILISLTIGSSSTIQI